MIQQDLYDDHTYGHVRTTVVVGEIKIDLRLPSPPSNISPADTQNTVMGSQPHWFKLYRDVRGKAFRRKDAYYPKRKSSP